jgi:hypothetical protein
MQTTPPTRRIGKCIYCLAECYDPANPQAPLGEEHVIPLSIGGQRVVRFASCKACEGVTSKIETTWGHNLVAHGRHDLGLYGRRASRRMRRASAALKPSFMMMFHFRPPGLLTGTANEDWPASKALVRTLGGDAAKRIRLAGGKFEFQFRHGGADTKTFSRLLAKIAHAHVVDVFGLDGFTPMLTNLIRDIPPLNTSLLIGSEATIEPKPAAPDRHFLSHEWQPQTDGNDLMLVRIRLFAHLGMPTHVAIAGSRPSARSPQG